jgi:hypothetical protein
MKEASSCFPAALSALREWRPPWEAAAAAPPPLPDAARPVTAERSPQEAAVYTLLAENPASVEALARLLGVEPIWAKASPAVGAAPAAAAASAPAEAAAHGLLAQHPESAGALAALLTRAPG